MTRAVFLLSIVVFSGCAVRPKPAALRQLETLLAKPAYKQAGRLAPKARQDVDHALLQAREAWLDNENARATDWARIGMLDAERLRVIATTSKAKADNDALQQQLDRARTMKVQLAARIEATEEKIMLYEELAMAEVGSMEKELELSDFQQSLAAQKKLSMAQLALKLAETVDAPRHVAASFRVAAQLIKKAGDALSGASFRKAAKMATQAKTRAEEAYQKARPQYLKVRKAAELQANSGALRTDAAKIDGVKPQLRKVGETRQLILPIFRLFGERSAIPRKRQLPVLNALAQVLKQHPSFPVIVNGYTSSKIARDKRYALSWSRAKQVVDYLLTFGLPFSRFAVCGRGDEERVAPPKSSRNDRVEIILLFQ